MVSSKFLGVRINLLYSVRSIVWETLAINLGEKMAENLAENLISTMYNFKLFKKFVLLKSLLDQAQTLHSKNFF